VIKAKIVLGKGGALKNFEANGHAERGAQGFDVVCAAFSILARTAYRSLEALPGVKLRGEASEPGSLSFEVLEAGRDAGQAAGIAVFLITGMGDVAREYPDAVAVTIERYLEE
jgi:uncharacterized protein YsxB (DUF464 family)